MLGWTPFELQLHEPTDMSGLIFMPVHDWKTIIHYLLVSKCSDIVSLRETDSNKNDWRQQKNKGEREGREGKSYILEKGHNILPSISSPLWYQEHSRESEVERDQHWRTHLVIAWVAGISYSHLVFIFNEAGSCHFSKIYHVAMEAADIAISLLTTSSSDWGLFPQKEF